jgi:hypothetical protein
VFARGKTIVRREEENSKKNQWKHYITKHNSYNYEEEDEDEEEGK